MNWIYLWLVGSVLTFYAYLVRLKFDYHCKSKTWIEFIVYLQRLAFMSKIVLFFELVITINILIIAWPIYWVVRLMDKYEL